MSGVFVDPLLLETPAGGTLTQSEFRKISAFISNQGVRDSGSLAAVSTSGLTTSYSAGGVTIPGTDTTNQGSYLCTATGTATITHDTQPASGQTRIDRVLAKVYDDAIAVVAGGTNEWKLVIVKGTAAATGTQTLPSLTGITSFVEIAQVTVDSTGSITLAQIKDVRFIGLPPGVYNRLPLLGDASHIPAANDFWGLNTFHGETDLAKVRIGSEPTAHGRSVKAIGLKTSFNHPSDTFIDPPWNNSGLTFEHAALEDDGPLVYTNPTTGITGFVPQYVGWYRISVNFTFGLGSLYDGAGNYLGVANQVGHRRIKVFTTSRLIAFVDVSAEVYGGSIPLSLCTDFYWGEGANLTNLPIRIQVFQDSGGTLSTPGTNANAPQQAILAAL